MNYAEDRLDRRARHDAGKDSLWSDYQEAVYGDNHELVARTLRDVGWNAHALFHYGQAWSQAPTSWTAAGDYAQMAELAGFPEVGVMALLTYRCHGALHLQEPLVAAMSSTASPVDSAWLQQTAPSDRHCGCGLSECGTSQCFIPVPNTSSILVALATYCHEYSERKERNQWTANEVLGKLANGGTLPEPDIPVLLQFWKGYNNSNLRHMHPVLQLLLIKLLYLTVPLLAAEAVVYATFEEPAVLATNYKSHWAYHVFIRALVLGERTKAHRKKHHVAVWDVLWGLEPATSSRRDKKHEETSNAGIFQMKLSHAFSARLRTYMDYLSESCKRAHSLPPLLWKLPGDASHPEPLYFVGDSHVLSLAWQTLWIPDSAGTLRPRLAVPVIATGLKAWHMRSSTRFFTRTCLKVMLQRLSGHASTIILSAGEIDCREGLGGPLLQGYTQSCHEHVCQTVSEYVKAIRQLVEESETPLLVLVMPIPPHGLRSKKKGRPQGQSSRREASRVWNSQLRTLLPADDKVFFLDYEADLKVPDQEHYVLKPTLYCDSTHMNAAFGAYLRDAIVECGCDLDRI